jgi:hypothetical protein
MLNIYKEIFASTITDDAVKAALASELATIGRINGFSPILAMNEAETNALEYRFIASYDKVIGPIYECFDKALNIEIHQITLNEFHPVVYSIRRDERVKDFYLALIGKSSFYDISSTTMQLPGVEHFMSRYTRIADMTRTGCCTML